MTVFNADYSMTIDGKAATSKATIKVVNPATEEILAEAPDASRAELDRAVAAARRAFQSWSQMPIKERQRRVAALGQALADHQEDFKRLLTLEQGKPRAGAEWEVGGSIVWCQEIAKQALPVEVVERTDGHLVERRHAPIGVVGAITPWNFPILLAVWKMAPALVAGNTIVLKPSPFTPLCTLKLGELARDIFPAGVVNIVSGGDDLGRWITSHPGIGKISFTGSCDTGKEVMKSAAGNLKRITLELGGNDPAIVLPDVDPKLIAKELFWASFQNSAQFCVACKRLYVHEDVYDDVLNELVEYAKTVKVGDGSQQGTDLGPIQNKQQFDKVRELIEDTKRIGARIALGGTIEKGPGYYVPVTIVDNPPDDSRVVVEEAFGPLLPVLKYKDIEDVIRRANDTPYGLAGSVWGKDVAKAKAIAERLETGTVWVNEVHVFAPHIAFGGHKQSGIGLENALEGLAEFTNSQTIMVNTAARV